MASAGREESNEDWDDFAWLAEKHHQDAELYKGNLTDPRHFAPVLPPENLEAARQRAQEEREAREAAGREAAEQGGAADMAAAGDGKAAAAGDQPAAVKGGAGSAAHASAARGTPSSRALVEGVAGSDLPVSQGCLHRPAPHSASREQQAAAGSQEGRRVPSPAAARVAARVSAHTAGAGQLAAAWRQLQSWAAAAWRQLRA